MGDTDSIAAARAELLLVAEQCRRQALGHREAATTAGSTGTVNTHNMRLDVFLAQHTSEDNAAFEDILSEEHAAARRHNWWLYERHDTGPHVAALSDNAEAVQALLRDRATEQGAAAGAAVPTGARQHDGLSAGSGVNHWVFRPKNQLFFTPDLAVSNHISKVHSSDSFRRDAQRPATSRPSASSGPPGVSTLAAPNARGSTDIIATADTHNVITSSELPQTSSALVALPSSNSGMAVLAPRVRVNAAGGRVQPRRLVHAATRIQPAVDLQDVFLDKHGEGGEGHAGGAAQRMQQLLRDRAAVQGYAYVSTPSPMPGAGMGVHVTPAMTWGAVAATPQLAVSDTGSSETPLLPRAGAPSSGQSLSREQIVSLDSGLLELLLQRAETQAGLAKARTPMDDSTRGGGGSEGREGGSTPFSMKGASSREVLARRMARRRGSTGGGAHVLGGGATPAGNSTLTTGVSGAALAVARSLLKDTPVGTPAFAATGMASVVPGASKGGQRGLKRPRSGVGAHSGTPSQRPLSTAAAALARQMGVRPPTGLGVPTGLVARGPRGSALARAHAGQPSTSTAPGQARTSTTDMNTTGGLL